MPLSLKPLLIVKQKLGCFLLDATCLLSYCYHVLSIYLSRFKILSSQAQQPRITPQQQATVSESQTHPSAFSLSRRTCTSQISVLVDHDLLQGPGTVHFELSHAAQALCHKSPHLSQLLGWSKRPVASMTLCVSVSLCVVFLTSSLLFFFSAKQVFGKDISDLVGTCGHISGLTRVGAGWGKGMLQQMSNVTAVVFAAR